MYYKMISGWFLADEEQGTKLHAMITELPENISVGWSFQARVDISPVDYKFVHFGALLDQEDENKFLEFLSKAASEVSSNYDEPKEYIEGDFFIMDQDRMNSELRLRIAHGSFSIDEREPYRPSDL